MAAELEILRQRDEELRQIRELTETVEQAIFAVLFDEMYDVWVNEEIQSVQIARTQEIEKGKMTPLLL